MMNPDTTAAASVDALYDDNQDENQQDIFNLQNLNHQTMLFCGGRKRESLNGDWEFTVDPFDTGLHEHWYRDAGSAVGQRRLPWDYDTGAGETIRVPSCWNLQRAEYFFYEGSAWYSRVFDYVAPPGPHPAAAERVFLRIGAASYDCKVFLNGVFLGNHYGASTPFFVELSQLLQPRNLLQLCVNNRRSSERVPMQQFDWFNYGGIYRDVELIRLPPVFIRDFRVHLVPDGRYDKIAVRVELSSASVEGEIRVRIEELGIAEAIRLINGTAVLELDARPQLWSLQHPKLYRVEALYRNDRVSDRVGFRQIETDGSSILLNGEKIFLRGICVHEDDPQLGKVSSDADLHRRYRHAKQLGCNFLRLVHYPHHERAAELADEAGLLLWQEIPVCRALAFANPATLKDADNQLRELIRRDYNRASVIIWGVADDTGDSDARLKFTSRLAQIAHDIDATRLVAAACRVGHSAKPGRDRLIAHLDVLGINGCYSRDAADLEQLLAGVYDAASGKPLIMISETGTGALAGRRGNAAELFSEEHMAEVYRQQIGAISQNRNLAIQGLAPQMLYDFRSQRRKNRFQQGFNRDGLIAGDKQTRKLAFEVLSRFYWSIEQ
jgi:beta-glucuronidase